VIPITIQFDESRFIESDPPQRQPEFVFRGLMNDAGAMHSLDFIFLNVAILISITSLYVAYQYFLLRRRIKLGYYRDVPTQ